MRGCARVGVVNGTPTRKTVVMADAHETQELDSDGAVASVQFDNARLIGPAMRDADWMVEMQILAEERKMMTREDLRLLHENLCEEARDLMKQKNEDYATESDVFRNFRMFGLLGVLVRMSDKIARLRTYAERGKFTRS